MDAQVGSVVPDFKLFSVNGVDRTPGQEAQGLHRDTLAGPEPERDFTVVNSAWMLDDFHEANGATRFVPQSHIRGDTVAICIKIDEVCIQIDGI